MAEPSLPYWDEPGIPWDAIDPKLRATASHHPGRLHRRAQWMAVSLVARVLLGAMGVLLGLATIGTGLSFHIWNFLTRGVAIIAMSVITMLATWRLQQTTSPDAAQALSQIVDLAINQAQKNHLIGQGWTLLLRHCSRIRARRQCNPDTSRQTTEDVPNYPSGITRAALAVVIWGRQSRLELGTYWPLKKAPSVDRRRDSMPMIACPLRRKLSLDRPNPQIRLSATRKAARRYPLILRRAARM